MNPLLVILLIIFFSVIASSRANNNLSQFGAEKIDKNLRSRQYSQQPKSSRERDQELIIGLWRGYHQGENFIMYYGYEFRADGTYLARHRVYQNETTIKDEFWQGQWQLDGDLLILEGVSQTENRKKVRIRFQLSGNNQLNYEGGFLPKPYIPLRLSKQD
jgi:hypothetical protein